VKVAAPGIGQQWTSFMSGGSSRMYPSTAWLSPLNHRDAFFSVAPAGTPEPETAKWRIPEEELETATVTVSPDEPAGSVLVRFEFPLAQLREYVIPERR
jgi:hypothetical protein